MPFGAEITFVTLHVGCNCGESEGVAVIACRAKSARGIADLLQPTRERSGWTVLRFRRSFWTKCSGRTRTTTNVDPRVWAANFGAAGAVVSSSACRSWSWQARRRTVLSWLASNHGDAPCWAIKAGYTLATLSGIGGSTGLGASQTVVPCLTRAGRCRKASRVAVISWRTRLAFREERKVHAFAVRAYRAQVFICSCCAGRTISTCWAWRPWSFGQPLKAIVS